MKTNQDLEFDLFIDRLSTMLVENGVTAAEINKMTIQSMNLMEQEEGENQPGILSRGLNWIKGMAARTGLKSATDPNQLLQQKKAVEAALTNYFTSIFSMGFRNADVYRDKMLNSINLFYNQVLARKFGQGDVERYGRRRPVATPAASAGGEAAGAPAGAGETAPAGATAGTTAPAGTDVGLGPKLTKEVLDAAKGKAYGTNRDGSNGDFSDFADPAGAQKRFLEKGPAFWVDYNNFASLMHLFGHKALKESFNSFYGRILRERRRYS